MWWTSETWTSLYILHRSTNLISLYIHCDVLLTGLCCLLMYVAGCGYIHICKHTQKQSSTTGNARAAWLYGMWKDWGRRERLLWVVFLGREWSGRYILFYSLWAKISWTLVFWSYSLCWDKRHWHVIGVELWPENHFCSCLPCLPSVFLCPEKECFLTFSYNHWITCIL